MSLDKQFGHVRAKGNGPPKTQQFGSVQQLAQSAPPDVPELPMDNSEEPDEDIEDSVECVSSEDDDQIIRDVTSQKVDNYLKEFGPAIISLAAQRFLVKEAKKKEAAAAQKKETASAKKKAEPTTKKRKRSE